MKIAVIHGQTHKGSTYHMTQMLLSKLDQSNNEIAEFYVNGIGDCVGCYQCIMKGEETCPHRTQIDAMIKSVRKQTLS